MSSSSTRAVFSEQLAPSRLTQSSQPKTLVQLKADSELPPFNVLLKWLSYYHTQTGTWPEPAAEPVAAAAAAAAAATNNPKSNEPTYEDKPHHLTILPGKSTTKNANNVVTTKQTLVPDSSVSNNYDFRSSIYYSTALALVETYEHGRGHDHAAAGRLSEASILTLASVLAWCHYPPFLTRYKERGAGPGMYLPLDQWSKSLRMRKATLGTSLKELEAAGLIKTSQSAVDETTNKKVTRYYRLAVTLRQPLPLFDAAEPSGPAREFAASVESCQNDPGCINTKAEPQSEEPEPESIKAPELGTEESTSSQPMNHDINYKNKKLNKPKNHDHEPDPSASSGTSEEKYEFLAQKACFPGYTSPEGLSALDSREALKFASNPALDLYTIQKVYHQVLSAWSTGKCTKNPIGFFHYTLTRHLTHKSATPSMLNNIAAAFESTWEPKSGTGKKSGSRNQLTIPYSSIETSYVERNGPGQDPNYDLVSTSDFSDTTIEDNEDAGQDCQVDITKIQKPLKERVVEALQDRFRQPALAAKLALFGWAVSLLGTNTNIELRLESQGSNFSGITTLSQSELSLLKIAASQALKGLTGRIYEIEVLVF